jgi:phosphohistidine phosphatase
MTVRTLILLRHAKAADPDDYATDIERPLTARGHRDAAAAGAWLKEHDLRPDAVLCSTAVRTRQTLEALGVEAPVVFEHRIYTGPALDTLELIRQTDPTVETLLLVGHNPTISDLSHELAPNASLDSSGLSTSGVAVHRFEGVWSTLTEAPLTGEHTARG